MKKVLLAVGLVLAVGLSLKARAGTIVASTTTYGGIGAAAIAANTATNSLPQAGAYAFGLSAVSAAQNPTFTVYLQQQGLSGAYYTIVNSTFTQCVTPCNYQLITDVYTGGNVRAMWYGVTSGSVTFTVTGSLVQP